jgi:hypothetical protein
VLIVQEASRYVEQSVNTELRRADIQNASTARGAPKAGEYTGR